MNNHQNLIEVESAYDIELKIHAETIRLKPDCLFMVTQYGTTERFIY